MTESHNHAKENNERIGNHVLVKQEKVNKSLTPFKHNPLKITAKKESMSTAEVHDHAITINSSDFKKIIEECSRAYKKETPIDEEVKSSPVTDDTKEDRPEVPINSKPSETPVLIHRSSSHVRQAPKYLSDYVIK